MESCAICLGNISRPIELSCSHRFCGVCLQGPMQDGMPSGYSCPLCRTMRIFDPEMLPERREEFRAGDCARGQGTSQGASGGNREIELDVSARQFPRVPQDGSIPAHALDVINLEKKHVLHMTEPTVKSPPVDELASTRGPETKCKQSEMDIAAVLASLDSFGAEEKTGNAPAAGKQPKKQLGRPRQDPTSEKAKRQRARTMVTNRSMTGMLHALVKTPSLSCIYEIDSRSLRNLGFDHTEERFGILVKFGAGSADTKQQLSIAITAILVALDGVERKPLKWDTLQRHMLWKYQRRFQADSLYLFEEDGCFDRRKIEAYGVHRQWPCCHYARFPSFF
jgi:hypothetical protein